MREIFKDRRVALSMVILGLAGVSFGVSYEVGSRLKTRTIVEWPKRNICLVPIAGQMVDIRRESRETNTPICDEKPIQPAVIEIPKELFEPVDIPPMAKK